MILLTKQDKIKPWQKKNNKIDPEISISYKSIILSVSTYKGILYGETLVLIWTRTYFSEENL